MTDKAFNKFIGFYLNDEMNQKFRMQSIAMNAPVSDLARLIVRNHFEGVSEEDLKTLIFDRMKADHELRSLQKKSNPAMDFDNHIFTTVWRKVLTRKLGDDLGNSLMDEYEKNYL